MKTNQLIKKSTGALVALGMIFIVFASQANGLSIQERKNNHTTEFHKALEEKGYTHIAQFSVSKSDVRQSKYFVNFVNFVNDGKVYDAYFTKKGELIEVYEMAKI